MSWGGGGGSEIEQAIQEMGCCNRPQCLRNRLFPKWVHMALGVLGVTDLVALDLEESDARDIWILEIRIDRQGST